MSEKPTFTDLSEIISRVVNEDDFTKVASFLTPMNENILKISKRSMLLELY